jgi:hypothetical protein
VQGIGGARPPQVAIGPAALRRDGTPAKPGFLQSKKCALLFTVKHMDLSVAFCDRNRDDSRLADAQECR